MMWRRKAGWVQNLCCGATPPNHGLCTLVSCGFARAPFQVPLLYVKWWPEDFELRSLLSSSHTLSLILKAFVFHFYRGRSKTPGLSKLGQGHKVNTHGSQDSNPGLSDFKVWARGPFIIPEVPTEMAELSGSWGLRKMINSDGCKFTTVR